MFITVNYNDKLANVVLENNGKSILLTKYTRKKGAKITPVELANDYADNLAIVLKIPSNSISTYYRTLQTKNKNFIL
ncbi:MAG: hypothetical protein PHX21_12925 [bacterium]|nr:hypothetical protein [bacterium]